MANGFVSPTGNADDRLPVLAGRNVVDAVHIWLVLGALSFAAIAESAGFLGPADRAVVARAKSAGALLVAVIFTASG